MNRLLLFHACYSHRVHIRKTQLRQSLKYKIYVVFCIEVFASVLNSASNFFPIALTSSETALCGAAPLIACKMSDSEDERPLAKRAQPKKEAEKQEKAEQDEMDTSDDDRPLMARRATKKRVSYVESGSDAEAASSSGSEDEDDDDDDVPLARRSAKKRKASPRKAPAEKKRRSSSASAPASRRKKGGDDDDGMGAKDEGASVKWTTLKHCGVLFPPEYEPHGIKMLYEGKPVDLTPEQEEVATMFAVMKETDYMNKPQARAAADAAAGA